MTSPLQKWPTIFFWLNDAKCSEIYAKKIFRTTKFSFYVSENEKEIFSGKKIMKLFWESEIIPRKVFEPVGYWDSIPKFSRPGGGCGRQNLSRTGEFFKKII